jgi:U3 small nucleolar RNA-associated protein 13
MKKIQTERSIEPFLSGRIAVDVELPHLTTLYDGNVLSVSESGEILATLQTQNANCVAIKRNRVAAGCHNHIQIYEDGELKATMKHSATVLCMDFHPSGLLLVAGYSDTTVRVWDLRHYRCTHAFKGHSSIVSTVIFHPTDLKVISGCEDGKIKIWSLETRACLATLDSHVSLITDLSCHNGILLSVGRDKILSIWDLTNNTLKHTILAFEMLESVGLVKESLIFAAGERGIIRLWDLNSAKEIAESESLSSLGIVQAIQKENTIYCVTQDRNILVYHVDDDQNLIKTKCLIGFNDEILDSVFLGSNENHLCIASNSEILKVYDMNTFDCDLVHGHSEIILCLASNQAKELLATGSKDQTTRVWSMVDGFLQTVAICKGHTGAVTAIAFSGKTGQSLFTCSQDHTVKHWKVPPRFANDQHLEAEYTVAAHDGDINSIDVAPNEKFFCTGSQDKTAKIWKSEDGSLVGVLKGHRRGVWSTRFSPVEQVVVTSSGDKTIKIWSLSDLSCLKVFFF